MVYELKTFHEENFFHIHKDSILGDEQLLHINVLDCILFAEGA